MNATHEVLVSPPVATVEALTRSIQQWLLEGHVGVFEFADLGLAVMGAWMPFDQLKVAINQSAKMLNEAPRIRQRLGEKVHRYAPHATGGLGLMVAVGANTWTVTRHGVATALFGSERVQVDPAAPDNAVASFDGLGTAVVGGPVGYAEAERLAGVWVMQQQRYDEERQALLLDAAFIHNPYCADPLPLDSFEPLPEMQPRHGQLSWVREGDHLLVLD
jgi:hypothetical protein